MPTSLADGRAPIVCVAILTVLTAELMLLGIADLPAAKRTGRMSATTDAV